MDLLIRKKIIDELKSRSDAYWIKGQFDLAKYLYIELIKIDPYNYQAYHRIGLYYARIRSYDSAHKFISTALKYDAGNVDALFDRANLNNMMGRPDEAIVDSELALKISGDRIRYSLHCAESYKIKCMYEAALDNYNYVLINDSDNIYALANKGMILSLLKRDKEALECYNHTLRKNDSMSDFHMNKGNALKNLNRYNEALVSYDRAINLDKNNYDAYLNKGNALQGLHLFQESIENYNYAIDINKTRPDAYWNRSLVYLLTGDYENGLREYEIRWKNKDNNLIDKFEKLPLWIGQFSIKNKTIILYHEQGMGDSIQFFRYVQMVLNLGARIIISVPSPLKVLFEINTTATVVENLNEDGVKADCRCPLMSLALAFRTTLSNIPSQISYIKADETKIQFWKNRLAFINGPKVGIAWSGNVNHKNDQNRSILLEDVIKYIPAEFTFVSVQKDIRVDDMAAITNSPIYHFGNELSDYSCTAGLCQNLDVIISVDTSIAHLCGAMGKTTLVMLPYIPDWRWLLGRDDSPWYKSVKIYRQNEDRNWDSVIIDVMNDIKYLISNRIN